MSEEIASESVEVNTNVEVTPDVGTQESTAELTDKTAETGETPLEISPETAGLLKNAIDNPEDIAKIEGQLPWFYEDGRPGEGERPEYLAEDFDTVSKQAEAYNEIKTKLGSFDGAPEEYDLKLLEEAGLEINSEDSKFKEFAEFAKDSQMSQDGFEKVMSFYVDKMAEGMVDTEAEMAKLGPNAEADLNLLGNWMNNNFTDNEIAVLNTTFQTADQIKVLQKLRDVATQKPSTPSAAMVSPPDSGMSKAKIDMMVADARYTSDPVYREEVLGKIRKYTGDA